MGDSKKGFDPIEVVTKEGECPTSLGATRVTEDDAL